MADITYDPAEVDPAEDPEIPVEDTLDPGEEVFDPAPVDPAEDPFEEARLQREADSDSEPIDYGPEDVGDEDPFEASRRRAEEEYDNQEPAVFGPEDVDQLSDEQLAKLEEEQATFRQLLQSEEAASQNATIAKAKQQATFQSRYKQPGNNDWRVRLVLAEGADYLYKANPPGILKPLADSNGVIFPYTPEIQTTYSANYEQYDLTHSNYRGYFYKNSKVGDINLTANFTAQDTQEAQYLLAVIHFFRSVTKMFYGKDAQRGAPPPLVYLVGLGDFQFNGHPCLVSNFQYTLPSDVDYIRANNPNNYGTNMLNRVSRATTATSPAASVLNRLSNAIDNFGRSLQPGATSTLPSYGSVLGSVNNTNRSTYVPTKMQISITLLPVQTRSQVSQQFSLKSFANGDLLKGGFW